MRIIGDGIIIKINGTVRREEKDIKRGLETLDEIKDIIGIQTEQNYNEVDEEIIVDCVIVNKID